MGAGIYLAYSEIRHPTLTAIGLGWVLCGLNFLYWHHGEFVADRHAASMSRGQELIDGLLHHTPNLRYDSTHPSHSKRIARLHRYLARQSKKAESHA